MICSILNASASKRVFYDVNEREIEVAPGALKHVDINEGTFEQLCMRGDLVIKKMSFARSAAAEPPPPAPATGRQALSVRGHFGIGDNIHQRAVMRELLKTYDVWLHTCHFELYHDLIERGLKLVMRPTSLHAQAKTMQREHERFQAANFPLVPENAIQHNIGYPKVLVDQHGSILEAMFSCVGLKMPERPDFSLPIKPEWRDKIRGAIKQWNPNGKPLLVHRPIVVRNEWDGRSRNPDPKTYDELFRSIRDKYFVISLADLAQGREWIEGPQQEADIKLHKGELAFPEMAALFAEADLVFCNAGFAPVLAQAVGTAVICVYGGRESYRTTQRVGAHLAPTCPIDPITPCDCHSNSHRCDKRIDVPAALAKIKEFVGDRMQRNTLLFGTFYVDSPDRDNLTDLWEKLHVTLNDQDCDFLVVDSQSPIKKFKDWTLYDGKTRHHKMRFDFPDNIGHLSRRNVTQGRDGWGRAFCKGLEIACQLNYEYVAHIEGDSLLRLPVGPIVQQMKAEGIDCASTHVRGMRNVEVETQWIETGLMFFNTDYIARSDFIKRYDWPNRRVAPTPERYINMAILKQDLNAKQFRIMPWKALRADKNQISVQNIEKINADWITHQHDSAQQGVYRKFTEMALAQAPARTDVLQTVAATVSAGDLTKPAQPSRIVPNQDRPYRAETCRALPLVRKNLGCGNNKLSGWDNHDADVDITKRLPWDDSSVNYVFAEHVVEHVTHKQAIDFFKEAHRVLVPGGVLRVTVPSLEQIAKCSESDYYNFTLKWQNVGPTKRGAMHAIIFAHGHQMIWNAQLMRDVLYFSGFNDVRSYEPGKSDDPVLRNIEGHGKVIGDRYNKIESATVEARKDGGEEVAIVIGGAECWQQDLEEARKIIAGRRARFFYVNDQIKSFPELGVACTLHPDKINGQDNWLGTRRKAGLPEPLQIWAHRKHACVTHDTASMEWRGSSGLFACEVARREGYKKVIGCGVPMTPDGGHFERHKSWSSAHTFRDGWIQHKAEIATFFRSMSGWTAEQFGKPDTEWLGGT